MPLATMTPILGKGPRHPGPAVTFALRGPKDGKSPGQKRRRWNGRHQIVWQNDMLAPNMRSYFDRHVDAVDIPVMPRRRLRPTWSINEPEVEPADRVYRVFDAATASWKEQTQWAALPMPPMPPPEALGAPGPLGHPGAAGGLPGGTPTGGRRISDVTGGMGGAAAPAAGAASAPQLPQVEQPVPPPRRKQRPRTPRNADDLRRQRELEANFDSRHSLVFSRFNDRMQVNVRSYFDRWKEDEGKSYFDNKDPTWRLPFERKPLIKSNSEPYIGRGGNEWSPNW